MKTLISNLPYDISNRKTVTEKYKGKQAFILTEGDLLEEACSFFGREQEGKCLKVFMVPYKDNEGIEDYWWGSPWRNLSKERTTEICKSSRLWETTIVQNLLWLNNMAPRVYGFVNIKQGDMVFPAQLVDFIEGEYDYDSEWIQKKREEVEDYLAQFGCVPWHKEQAGSRDFKDGKVVDPQGARFTDKTPKKIAEFISKHGTYGKSVYQSIEEIGIGAHPRNTPDRVVDLGLDKIDWEGKSVMDVGCNVGVFCNYAYEHGAKRVVGIDQPAKDSMPVGTDRVRSAQVLSFYLGNHNIDYVERLLPKEKIDEDFDITLFLSMYIHVGMPQWVIDQTNELMIFEENAKGSKFKPDYWIDYFSNYFKEVKQIGVCSDHGKKPIIWCKK